MYRFETGKIQCLQGVAGRLPLHPSASADTVPTPANGGDEFLSKGQALLEGGRLCGAAGLTC